MVQEWHAGFEAVAHRHVVHALDRVVHEHDRRVQPQSFVDGPVRARSREMLGHERPAVVLFDQSRMHREPILRMVAVEERGGVGVHRLVRLRDGHHRRVPVIPGKHLVRPLPGLHDLHVPGHLLAQQVEADRVVADHRFAHRINTAPQGAEGALGRHDDAVMCRAEAFGDDVGVLKLVARLAFDRLEADGEGVQSALTRFGQQADDQA